MGARGTGLHTKSEIERERERARKRCTKRRGRKSQVGGSERAVYAGFYVSGDDGVANNRDALPLLLVPSLRRLERYNASTSSSPSPSWPFVSSELQRDGNSPFPRRWQ